MRRIIAAVAVAFCALLAGGLAGGLAGAPSLAPEAHAAAVPGQAGPLGGYGAAAAGAPVSVLLYEPVIPIPAEPQLELDLAYTRTALDTGPTASALASTLWPGDAVGQGLGTLTGQEGQEYPVKSMARHPGGPAGDRQEAAPGSAMETEAGGRSARAHTRLGTVPPTTALLATARSVTSTSDAGLARDGSTVTARAVARATDVLLLGGLVRIDKLRVESVATSDGKKGTTDGGLTVAGLSVLGQPFDVGPDGVEAPAGRRADARELGISVRVLPSGEKVEGAKAENAARPLVVSVDTKRLRRMLDAPLGPFVDALPEDTRAEFAPVLALAPRIDFVVGNMAAAANATPAIGTSVPPGQAGPGPAGSGSGDPLSSSTPAGLGSGTAGPGSPESTELPLVAGDEKSPYSFGGIPAALVVGAAAGSLLAGWALRYLGVLLVGGGLGECDLGAARGVPNLREGAP
ncbi:MAG: hypothetical protein GEV03_24180 [Streptosporangiales bacterium]|nr:hypothetical protein [Streptosporangiales bacterium]